MQPTMSLTRNPKSPHHLMNPSLAAITPTYPRNPKSHHCMNLSSPLTTPMKQSNSRRGMTQSQPHQHTILNPTIRKISHRPPLSPPTHHARTNKSPQASIHATAHDTDQMDPKSLADPFPHPTNAPVTPHKDDPSCTTMSNLHIVNPSIAANPKRKRLDEDEFE